MTKKDGRGGPFEDMDPLNAEEASVLRALKSLPVQKARPEVRERIRMRFVQSRTERRLPAGIGHGALFSRRFALAVAAALVVILAGGLYFGTRPSARWFLTDVVAPEGIGTGTTGLSAGDIVTPGSFTTGAESELAIQLGDRLQFRMLAGTEIVLPAPPGRWFGKSRMIRLTDGEIYGTTDHGGSGLALTIQTPEATGRLLGTTFACFRTEEGTCFCLWSGGIEVTPADGSEPVIVPVEHKFYVYKNGSTSEILPIDDRERMKLSMTHDAGLEPVPPANR